MKKKYIVMMLMILMLGFCSCSSNNDNSENSDSMEEADETKEPEEVSEQQEDIVTDLLNENGVAVHLISNERKIQLLIKGLALEESQIQSLIITLGESSVDFTNQSQSYESDDETLYFAPYIVLKSNGNESSGYNDVTVEVEGTTTKITIPPFGNQYFDMSDVLEVRMEGGDISEVCQVSSYSKEDVETQVVTAKSGNSIFGSGAATAGIEEYQSDASNISLLTDDFCLISEYDDVSYSGIYKDLAVFVFDESGNIIQCFRRQKMEPGEYGTEYVPGYNSDLVYEECDPTELALYYGIDLSLKEEYPSPKERFLYKEYARKNNDGWKYQTVFMSKPILSSQQLGEEVLVKISDFGVPQDIFTPGSEDYRIEQTTLEESFTTLKGDEFSVSSLMTTCYEYNEAGIAVKGTSIQQFEDEKTALEYVEIRGGEQKGNFVILEILDLTNHDKRNSINCSKPLTWEQLQKQYAVTPIS